MSGRESGDDRDALTEPVPDDEGNPGEERQPWGHAALVPVRIILRDFAASRFFPAEGEAGETENLLEFIREGCRKRGLEPYAPILEARLCAGEALVLFDGLDEVPQAGKRCERLIQAIHAFTGSYESCRFLVTCRPYAYAKGSWRLTSYEDATLAD